MDYEIAAWETVSMGVVRAVSSVLGHDQCEIRPLGEILDPDALNSLFAPRENGEHGSGGEVSFIYSGCRVTVQNAEYISVEQI